MSPSRSIRPWLPLPLLALCLLVAACTRKAPAPPQGDQPVQQTPEKITAVELVRQRIQDGRATQAKYGDKPLEVTGVVCWITSGHIDSNAATIWLAGIEPPKTGVKADGLKANYDNNERIDCQFPKARALAALALLPAQTVTIRGKFSTVGTTRTLLQEAEVVSTGDIPVKKYTLPEVRKALGVKRPLGLPQGMGGPLILEGTLKAAEENTAVPGNYTVTAEDASAADEPPLTVRMSVNVNVTSHFFAEYVKGLKPGSAFRAHGTLKRQGEVFFLEGWRRQTILLPQ